MPVRRRLAFALLAACSLFAVLVASASAHPGHEGIAEIGRFADRAPSSLLGMPRAVIHADSVISGAASREATIATNAGFEVTVVSAATWSAMTQADFASYQVIIVGDPSCGAVPASVTANRAVWAPVVMGTAITSQPGNRIVIGTDPVYHGTSHAGAYDLMDAGIRYAGAHSGRTGAYFTASCDRSGGTVPILESLSAGTGAWTQDNTPPCGGSASVIAANPAFSTVTSSDLQGWSCSIHETFPTYRSDWSAFAIATDTPDKPTCGVDTETGAAACGQAYVLIAGTGTVVAAPNLALNPADATSTAGGNHTVTATVTEGVAMTPKVGQIVTFTLTGTNAGVTGSCVPAGCSTGADGTVAFTYPDTNGVGDDTITASFTAAGSTQQANAQKHWTAAVVPQVAMSATNPLAPAEGSAEYTYDYTFTLPGAVASRSTSCGTGVKVAASDTETGTGGSFRCVFADGPDSTTVSASMTDTDGQTGMGSQTVAPANVAPTASLDAGNALSVDEGPAEVTFTYTTADAGQDSVTVVTSCGGNGTKVAGSDTAGAFRCVFALGNRTSTVTVTPTDSDGLAGAPVSQVVTINDVTAPQTAIGADPAEGAHINDSTPAISFSSSEPGSTFMCRIDGGTPVVCTSPFTTSTLGDGEHTFSVVATDASGNVDPTAATRTFTVDTNAPRTAIDIGPTDNTTIADNTPTIVFISDEPGSTFMCRIDGGSAFVCNSPFTPSALPDGVHTFSVAATDRAGNVDLTPATRTFTVDSTAPQTTIDSPAAGSTTADNTPALAFSSSETGSTFTCKIDDGVAVACDSPLTPSALADGPHTFTVIATDAVGNVDQTPATRTFTVDTTAPETTIGGLPVAGSTIADSTPEIAFSSSEAGSTFSCSIDDGPAFSCSSPFEPSELSDGEHTFSVTATDVAGNVDLTPVSRTFAVDTGPPQTTIDGGPDAGSTIADSTPDVTFSSSEAGSTFSCRVDDGVAFVCESPLTLDALGDGEHTFSVTATDGVGNEDQSPALRTFTVDTADPQTTIDSGPVAGSTIADSTPEIVFSADQSGSAFSCTIDDGAAFSCASPYTSGVLADGEHTFSVTATDVAGNADESPALRTFTVDATAPQTTITDGPAAGATIADTTPTFALSSSEAGSTFSCKIDNGAEFACDSPYTPSALADGEHTFTVSASDAVTNKDQTPATRTFTVDTGLPETTITDGPATNSTIADNTPTMTFASSETRSTFACRIDGGAPFACAASYTTSALADGEHTFSVTATDAAGNVDQTPATRTFTVNTTPAVLPPVVTPPPAIDPPPAVIVKPPVAVSKRCGSRRRFTINLRPKDVRLVSALVKVNDVKVKVRRKGTRLQSTVDLRKLAKGTYKVTIVARDAEGRRYRETRRYLVC